MSRNREDSTKRLSELDGIRGLAIIAVLAWHYFAVQVKAPPHSVLTYLVRANMLAWSGVDLFFVLSGFLIAGLLLDNRTADNYYQTFYIRRVCRIVPLYVVMLLSFVLLVILHPARLEWLYAHPLPLWSYGTFTQNYVMAHSETWGPAWLNVTWSLAIEEQFYLLLPFLIRRTPSVALPFVIVAMILLGPISRHFVPHFSGYILTFSRSDSVMVGVLLAYVTRQPRIMGALEKTKPMLWSFFPFFFAGLGALTIWSTETGGVITHFGLAILYGGLVLVATLGRGSYITALLSNRVLVWFGLRSYCIYLVHQPVSGVLHGLFDHNPPKVTGLREALVTVVAFIVVMGVAEVSMRYLEGPFLRLGRNYRYLRAERGAACAAGEASVKAALG